MKLIIEDNRKLEVGEDIYLLGKKNNSMEVTKAKIHQICLCEENNNFFFVDDAVRTRLDINDKFWSSYEPDILALIKEIKENMLSYGDRVFIEPSHSYGFVLTSKVPAYYDNKETIYEVALEDGSLQQYKQSQLTQIRSMDNFLRNQIKDILKEEKTPTKAIKRIQEIL